MKINGCGESEKTNPIKPNSQKAQMNVSSLITKDYRKKDDFAVRKNKPNFRNAQNERKPLCNKGLWQFPALRPQKNKPKTNPISNYPCIFEWLLYNLVFRDDNGRNFDGEYIKWQMHRKQMQ